MAENIYKIELKNESESFYFLPKPQYDDALYYLTSTAHEYTLPDFYIERSDTDAYMLNYTLNGKGQFVYNGKMYELTPGTLVFAYLGVHNILFPITDDFEYCCFHLNGAQIKSIYRYATDNGINPIINGQKEDVLLIFEKIKQLLLPPTDFFEISKILGNLLTDLLNRSVNCTKTMSPLAHEVYKMVLNNNTRVDEIANKLGYSPVHLERIFKKETGYSIQSAIVRHKVEQAEQLLLTTSLSVNAIAKKLGYSDTVGLVHLFKKHLDCTPLEFRKRKQS